MIDRINKEDFEILIKAEMDAAIGPVQSGRYAGYISGTKYVPSPEKCKSGVVLCSVYHYSDRYTISIYYQMFAKNIELSFETEEEAYGMLYRFLFKPEMIRFVSTNRKGETNTISQEDFGIKTQKLRGRTKFSKFLSQGMP